MATPTERTCSAPDARDLAATVVGDDPRDSAFAEWGYEAADLSVVARQWGESGWSVEERSR